MWTVPLSNPHMTHERKLLSLLSFALLSMVSSFTVLLLIPSLVWESTDSGLQIRLRTSSRARTFQAYGFRLRFLRNASLCNGHLSDFWPLQYESVIAALLWPYLERLTHRSPFTTYPFYWFCPPRDFLYNSSHS